MKDASPAIPRKRGDDVLVTLRIRRSAFDRLTSDSGMALPVLASELQLRPEPEPDTYALVVWAPESPPYDDWPEPIPASESASELLRNSDGD